MKNRISLNEFAFHVASIKRKHPNAIVLGIGERFFKDQWYFALHIEEDGKESIHLIPERSKE